MDSRGSEAIAPDVRNRSTPSAQFEQVKCHFPRKEAADFAVQVSPVCSYQFPSHLGRV